MSMIWAPSGGIAPSADEGARVIMLPAKGVYAHVVKMHTPNWSERAFFGKYVLNVAIFQIWSLILI